MGSEPKEHPAKSTDEEHIGKTFGGKYRIEKLIAKGGMGRVFKATQFPLGRPVAIKVLNREFQQSDPQFVKRFFLEASIAAQLSHPHTITVFDYGESDTGDLYIAMEYLKGRPLSRILRSDGPFEAEEAIKLSVQIARALRAAHEKGVIHRDLKPGNIFILEELAEDGGGYAKVLDFGLVKLFTPEGDEGNALGPNLLGDGESELTRTGTLLGSPKYMSPEQIQGLKLDPRTDIYSFGIIMYQMISGKAPFLGATGVDVIYKHINFPVPAISTTNPDVDCPPELEAVIRKCLEKRREDRYSSMDALIEALRDAKKLISGVSVASESISSSDASSSGGQKKALALSEPIAEEPTPAGALAPEATGSMTKAAQEQRPPRGSIAIAGVGFAIAVLTMIYVLAWSPSPAPPPPQQQPKPVVQVEQKIQTPPPIEEPAVVPEEPRKEEEPVVKKKKKKKANEEVEVPPNYRENPY
jgi:eukaryotic-like serine/threonine-protein kinase